MVGLLNGWVRAGIGKRPAASRVAGSSRGPLRITGCVCPQPIDFAARLETGQQSQRLLGTFTGERPVQFVCPPDGKPEDPAA